MMDDLANKRVVILGLARQGRAMARFAAAAGAEVVVSDLSSAGSLVDSVAELADLDIEFVLGEHPLRLLDGTDVLVVSGGVPLEAPIVVAAQEQNIRLTNDSLEFVRRAPAPVVGITGSAGKTTTTALLGRMGEMAGCRTWVGGNIGRPLLSELPEMRSSDLIVQELSSFQLELWTESPEVAAVLNVTPNHLDRHKTIAAYAAAKANILRFQGDGDVAVLCADDDGAMALQDLVRGRLRTFSRQHPVSDGAFVRAGQVWVKGNSGASAVCELGEIKLRGQHNVLNVLAAVTLADSVGIEPDAMRRAVDAFSGVAHRLEEVDTINGVQYINDSIATAPERALAAIEAIDAPLILLAGGRDKAMTWDAWTARVHERAKHVIVFGELAAQMERWLAAAGPGGPYVSRVNTVDEAVEVAAATAAPGECVLLAPGGTSYDAFRDFEERGERFRQVVSEIRGEALREGHR